MVLDLKGDWSLTICGKTYPAKVPGSDYTDLINAGALMNPFYGLNESAARWVGEKDSLFKKEFEVDKTLLEMSRISLVCTGIDTICKISLNGALIAETDNAFRIYRFDIKSHLKKGKNVLELLFSSPVEWVKQTNAKDPLVKNFMGLSGIQHLRKPSYHFGWDWGPSLPLSGITGDIFIQGYETRIEDVKIVQDHKNGIVKIKTEVKAEGRGDGEILLKVYSPEGKIIASENSIGIDAAFEAIISQPELWYPNGLGSQPLYNVEITLNASGKIIDKKVFKIGLRELKLDTSQDGYGSNFCFYINGIKLFAKGANWIPSDSFPTRTNAVDLEFYIKSAAEANMNMLRVWGGGYYESDIVYDLCDRYGILVWQDFCYACYPAPFYNQRFIENALIEAEDNIKRLRHHASLCLWCGNNEIEIMSPLWAWKTRLKTAQKVFFYEKLKDVAALFDGITPYWAGSPTSGKFLKNAGSDNYGDTHLWQVWHGLRRPEHYRKRQSRFISEFGLEALPTLNAIKSFAEDKDMNIDSLVMKAHQKCAGGNGKMLYYLMLDYPLPNAFPDLVYLSGLTQAYTIKKAVLGWRKAEERTHGALYWQYNDCWPVSSWASVDYTKSFKALYYFAKRFFSPVALYLEKTRGRIKVFGINDNGNPFKGSARIKTLTFDGRIIAEEIKQVTLESGASTEIFLNDEHIPNKNTYMLAELFDAKGKLIFCERELYAKDKSTAFTEPKFDVSVRLSEQSACITVKTDVFARNVFVDIEGIPSQFNDNYIDIDAGGSYVFEVELPEPTEKADIVKRLTIKSVNTIIKAPRIKALKKKLAILAYPPNVINALAQLLN